MSSKNKIYERWYKAQRHGARQRDIGFELSFSQWLRIWKNSGQLHNRGAKRGQYVMARYRDRGPYKVGNVKIITAEANGSEKRHTAAHKEKMRLLMLGNSYGLGVKLSKETRAKMSRSRMGRKFSLKTRKKIAKALTGNKNALGHRHSLASRQKMSISISAARLRERLAREANQ